MRINRSQRALKTHRHGRYILNRVRYVLIQATSGTVDSTVTVPAATITASRRIQSTAELCDMRFPVTVAVGTVIAMFTLSARAGAAERQRVARLQFNRLSRPGGAFDCLDKYMNLDQIGDVFIFPVNSRSSKLIVNRRRYSNSLFIL